MNINKLNKLFNESKLSKVEFAKRCGITRVTLDNALQGGDIRVSILERIAATLKIPVGSIFDDDAPHGHSQVNGDGAHGNINGNSNVVSTGDTAVLEERVKSLEAQLKAKDTLISEKERLIKIYEKMMKEKE